MNNLIECVPNFSEGKDPATVQAIIDEIRAVQGITVLNTHIDPDHNRSVITFLGNRQSVSEAAFRAVTTATKLIDLRAHTGLHPRIGATDVLPFVPLAGTTMEECISVAHEVGERIASELKIPVYFYERASKRADRTNLEDIRRGGFEVLSKEIEKVPEREPDLGPRKIHSTAGAIVVGARPILIAFNVNLRTTDVGIAKKIARTVRGRNGGLKFLKAIGLDLSEKGYVQVSMNLVNYEMTKLHQAFDAVKREAEHLGVSVMSSEIIGLIPRRAVEMCAEHYMLIENFSSDAVIENRLGKRESS
jgi:glutamate formiminotransferase